MKTANKRLPAIIAAKNRSKHLRISSWPGRLCCTFSLEPANEFTQLRKSLLWFVPHRILKACSNCCGSVSSVILLHQVASILNLIQLISSGRPFEHMPSPAHAAHLPWLNRAMKDCSIVLCQVDHPRRVSWTFLMRDRIGHVGHSRAFCHWHEFCDLTGSDETTYH